jgi:hypothetical protein
MCGNYIADIELVSGHHLQPPPPTPVYDCPQQDFSLVMYCSVCYPREKLFNPQYQPCFLNLKKSAL